MPSLKNVLAILVLSSFAGAMVFTIKTSMVDSGWADAIGKRFDAKQNSVFGVKELDSFLFLLQNFFTEISGPFGDLTLAILTPIILQFFALIMVDSSRAHAHYPLYPLLGLLLHTGAAGLAVPVGFALYFWATGEPKSGSAGVSLTSSVYSLLLTIFCIILAQLFPIGSIHYGNATLVLILVQVTSPLVAVALNLIGKAESSSQRLAGATLFVLNLGLSVTVGLQTWYPAVYGFAQKYFPYTVDISNYTSFPPTVPEYNQLSQSVTSILNDLQAAPPVIVFLVGDAVLSFASFAVFAAAELGVLDALRGLVYAIFFSPAAATAFWLSKRQAKFYEVELNLAKRAVVGKDE